MLRISLKNTKLPSTFGFLLLIFTLTFSCKKGDPIINLPLHGPNQDFYVLADNSLLKFNADNIKKQLTQVAITGLSIAAEKLLSIDFRPATGELYGVSDASKIYIIDIVTGKARLVSVTAFTPVLDGTVVSLDFNPAVDRMRIVTNTGQNLRLNPETGLVVSADANIANTNINGIAYSNNKAGASTTTLYDIDVAAKILYKQDPPDNGTLVKVGSLELDLGTNVSFDISANNKNAIAIGKTSTGANLYTIDLSSGLAKLVGRFPVGLTIQGIAMPVDPVAYAVDNANNFIIFNPLSSGSTLKAITGLQANEVVLGMDMRPENGQIYALGSSNRLYTVNIGTGAFTAVGVLSIPISGTSFGFDFNPLTNTIGVLSNTGQSLSINPITAGVTVETSIITSTATLSAAAYNNNFKGANTTALYAIDHTVDKLYTLNVSTGVLTVVGDLKADIENANGFDIISTASTNTAYGIFRVDGKNLINRIDLATGLATTLGEFSNQVTAFTLGLRY